MAKAALIVLADTETREALGRVGAAPESPLLPRRRLPQGVTF